MKMFRTKMFANESAYYQRRKLMKTLVYEELKGLRRRQDSGNLENKRAPRFYAGGIY